MLAPHEKKTILRHMLRASYTTRRFLRALCHALLLMVMLATAGGIHMLPVVMGSYDASAHARCAHGCSGVCCCTGAAAGDACGENPAAQNKHAAYAACGVSTPQDLFLALRWEALPCCRAAVASLPDFQDLHFFFIAHTYRDFRHTPPDPPPRWC